MGGGQGGVRRGWIVANGLTLAYQDWGGAGRPCLLLHGVFGRTTTWERTARALRDVGWRPIALDMRGHGLSRWPKTGYDRATLVSDVEQAMEALGMRDALVVGHSIGSLNAWCLADRRPDLVGALVAVDMPPELPLKASAPHVAWAESLPVPFASVEAARHFFLRSFPARPRTADYFLETLRQGRNGYGVRFSVPAVRESFRGIAERSWMPELHRVRQPTLIVRGDQGAIPAGVARDMVAGLERGELITVPKAGHALHYDNEEGWRRALVDFVGRV